MCALHKNVWLLSIDFLVMDQQIGDETRSYLEDLILFSYGFIARLWNCNVTEEGCTALASAFSSNSSNLRELDLSYNELLQDSGVKQLAKGLENPHCNLKILR